MSKRIVCMVMALVMILAAAAALGDGILEGQELVAIPSLGDLLHRYPTTEITKEDGSVLQTWEQVTAEDYTAIGAYLAEQGAVLKQNGTADTVVNVKGITFTLTYDAEKETLVVGIPAGAYDPRSANAAARWQEAMQLVKEGKTDEAYLELTAIADYKTYPGIGTWLGTEAMTAAVDEKYAVGKHVFLGRYEQDNNPENGPEPIEWVVLDIINEQNKMNKKVTHKALLLSVYALDVQPYNTDYTAVVWKESTLRSWLNEDFLNAAFNEGELAIIDKEAKADNADDQGNSAWAEVATSGGGKTSDLVFLLSYREAFGMPKDYNSKQKDTAYFENDAMRVCALTDYAVAKGAFTSDATVDGKPAATWWLRSPGKNQFSAAGVLFDGGCISGTVDSDYMAVRPAIWIDLENVGE